MDGKESRGSGDPAQDGNVTMDEVRADGGLQGLTWKTMASV